MSQSKEELGERVDSYLEYVADEWFQENALAVEQGLKSEITESFLDGMKGLFEEHYVTIPEEKYDVLESMVDKLDEMESKLNEQIERNVALNRRLQSPPLMAFLQPSLKVLQTLRRKNSLLSQKMLSLKVKQTIVRSWLTLRSSYFPESASTPSTSENLSEEVSTDEVISEEVSPMMQAYLQTLSRAAKK